jgi:hypothetical protein
VELPGIELGAQNGVTCEKTGFDHAKRRETTRHYLRIREGVDRVNTTTRRNGLF